MAHWPAYTCSGEGSKCLTSAGTCQLRFCYMNRMARFMRGKEEVSLIALFVGLVLTTGGRQPTRFLRRIPFDSSPTSSRRWSPGDPPRGQRGGLKAT